MEKSAFFDLALVIPVIKHIREALAIPKRGEEAPPLWGILGDKKRFRDPI